MKFAIAGFTHETVTFLPRPTTLAEFERNAVRGEAMAPHFLGSNSVIGGFLSVCGAHGIEIVGLVASECSPSGPVEDAAFEAFAREIVDGLIACRNEVDGLLLDLHGAMATPLLQDPESELLHRLREAVGREFPIAVALDLHGNLSPRFAELADIACGFHHSPHIDMARTGARTADLLRRAVAGEIKPVLALRKPGLVLPSIFTATALSPLAEIMAEARTAERADEILDVSVFTGFAYADVHCIGASVVTIADGDELAAQRTCRHLSDRLRDERHALLPRAELLSPAAAVGEAVRLVAEGQKPVVILEHADRMNDSTYVLAELQQCGVGRVFAPYICDPVSVKAALETGVGGQLMTAVGGRSSAQAGAAVLLAGRVLHAGPKRYQCTGPYRTGQPVDLGDTAVLDTGAMTLILTSRNVTAVDLDPFTQFGLDPADFDIILLRSKTHFRAAYEPVAKAILIADTPDWGPADLARLPYRNVPPGVYPVTA